jgi:hypothetical protein
MCKPKQTSSNGPKEVYEDNNNSLKKSNEATESLGALQNVIFRCEIDSPREGVVEPQTNFLILGNNTFFVG